MKEQHPPEVIPSKTFNGTTDLEDYLVNFNEIAKLQKWDDSRKRIMLLNKLEGEAMTVVSSAKCDTFQDVIKVLRDNFASTDTSVFALKLHSLVQKKGEDFEHLAREVKKIGKKAYPTADEPTLNNLLTDCFINAIQDESLRAMVRFKDPGNLQEAVKTALKVSAHTEQERKLVKKNVVKSISMEHEASGGIPVSPELHQLTDRVAKLETRRSGHQQQKFKGKKMEQKKKTERKGPPKCYHCGMPGHIRKYCPFDQQNTHLAGYNFQPPPPPIQPYPHPSSPKQGNH